MLAWARPWPTGRVSASGRTAFLRCDSDIMPHLKCSAQHFYNIHRHLTPDTPLPSTDTRAPLAATPLPTRTPSLRLSGICFPSVWTCLYWTFH